MLKKLVMMLSHRNSSSFKTLSPIVLPSLLQLDIRPGFGL